MTATSFVALVYQSVDALLHPEVPHGISIIIVLIAFFGSLHLLVIAILGEYVIKILEETKQRPRFIRKAVRHRGTRFTKPAEIDNFLQGRPAASQRPPGTQPFESSREGDGS
jgi:hypothetical protein